MEQKCSQDRVFSVFVDEPLKIHYIKEIAKKISLAPTSVKNHLKNLENQELIQKKKGERFVGFIANRDNKNFLFYKKIANIIKIKESGLLDFLIDSLYPQAIILYGSYLKGEDIESSDVDVMIITDNKKQIDIKRFEKILKRNIHLIMEKNLKKLHEGVKTEVTNGFVLYGRLKNE
ncbi:nucleotidyltransferase domain protein [archaeon BMS3Abin17]|nr:nucleotidyltransferase domain protein [archaeon BMS3Abin17]